MVGAQTKADTAKVKLDTLHLPAIDKPFAKQMLEALSIGHVLAAKSEEITAKQFNESAYIYQAFMQLIFRKWPDLQPKPQVQK